MAMSLSLGLGLTSIPVLQRGEATDYATTWNFFRGDAEFAKTPWAALTRSGAGTRINASGLIESTTSPRIDYDPVTLAARGLLGEGQAAEEINSHSLASPQMVTQTITVTAAQRTLSFYGTGTVTLSGAHSATVVGTGAYPSRKTYTFTPSAGSLTLTVSGTVQYPQLILGAVAQSYIPNPGTGTAVRVADDWYLSGGALDTALGPARTTATLYFEAFIHATPSGQNRVFYLGTDDFSRRVDVAMLADGTVLFYVNDGAGLANNLQGLGSFVLGSVNKVALAFNGTNIRGAVNGVVSNPQTSVFGGPSMTPKLRLLHAPGQGYLNSYVKASRAYPGRAMSIAEMQALTA